jgi:predicted ester cyclase
MTNDEIHSFLERFRHAWESRRRAVGCYAQDCVVVSPIFNTSITRAGREIVRGFLQGLRDTENRVDDIVIGNEEPPRAAVVWNMHVSHVGEVFGMPASGKRIERTTAFILTLKDGLITKEVRIYDFTSLLIQPRAVAKPAHN